jgi:predicted lipoprotein
VVLPALAEHARATELLQGALLALEPGAQNEELAAAQSLYRAARAAWKRSSVFHMGPAEELRLTARIDQSPVDAPRIEAHLASRAAVDVARLAMLGADMLGYHSLEYLLFADRDALASDARRRAYLAAAGTLLSRDAERLSSAWSDDYALRFQDPAHPDAVHASVREAVDALVNACVFTAESLADLRLGKPMGLSTGGDPRPELEESPYADGSVDDLFEGVRGLADAYLGSRSGQPGLGLTELVSRESAATDARVRRALSLAQRRVAAIPRPFRQALLQRAPELSAAHAALKEVVRLFAADLVAVLGATLSFNANDGD